MPGTIQNEIPALTRLQARTGGHRQRPGAMASAGTGAARQSPMQEIFDKMLAAHEASNQANQERYDQGLGLLYRRRDHGRTLMDQAQGHLSQTGQFALNEADRAGRERLGAGTQDMVSRGLTNSTVMDAMRRREHEATDRTKASIRDQTAGRMADFGIQRTAMESGLTGDVAGWIERRSDIGPDLGGIAQLMMQEQQARAARRGNNPLKSLLGGVFGGAAGAAGQEFGSGLGSAAAIAMLG